MNASSLRIVTPSRLHFGLLSWGECYTRQFGSVGLMVESPGFEAEIRPSDTWSATGPLAERALATMRRVAESLEREGRPVKPLRLTIDGAPHEHVGLGTGTQLSLGLARLVLAATGEDEPSVARLAALTGRGQRSGIGLHGFALGGLLVDGGRSGEADYPPLLSRIEFPREWSILVVIPPVGPGLAGLREREAFARLPPTPASTVDRLCRIVLLGLLPAAAEADLPVFGAALSDLQHEVGRGFAPAQGGLFAHPLLEAIAEQMKRLGLVGVGQSSWGPTLFAITRRDPDRQASITASLRERFGLEANSFCWTVASNNGARLTP
jgi:beta-ribofuranosylaminobenzene 5'-phosphate synthase